MYEDTVVTIPEGEEWKDYVQAVINEGLPQPVFKVGQKVKFHKTRDAIIVGIAQWDADVMRWKMPNGEYSVFGPYVVHILDKNLIIGAAESELSE